MPLTSNTGKSQITDDSGNQVELIEGLDGTYHLAVSMNQKILVVEENSSTTNLDAGNSYTFTGTGVQTSENSAIQVSLKADQNATVYIEQSPDGTNWDISDDFIYYYSKGGTGWTAKILSSYVRIRVVLLGTSATTYFRLVSTLSPVSEALPRALSHSGRLKTETQLEDSQVDRYVAITPLNELKVIEPVRLVGTGFSGTTKDTNFWTETVTGSGAVTQAGQTVLATGATADSTAKLTSVRRGRKNSGSALQFRSGARFITAGTANNIRRIGVYDGYEGFFFQLNNTTFSVVARTGGSDANIVNSGSFNGNLGATYVMDTNIHRLVIIYSEISVEFYVDGVLLHTMRSLTTPFTTSLTLPITMENINSGGSTTPVSFSCRFACIVRLGKYESATQYKYINTNTTTVLKYTAGQLHTIVVVDNAGTISVYDGVSAAGTLMCVIDAAKVLGTINFDVDFSVGLTIVTAGNSKATVIYE